MAADAEDRDHPPLPEGWEDTFEQAALDELSSFEFRRRRILALAGHDDTDAKVKVMEDVTVALASLGRAVVYAIVGLSVTQSRGDG